MTIRIALDAMGGDSAPREIVKGAVMAVQDAEVLRMANQDLEIVLVGRQEDIEKELSHLGKYPKKSISIVNAREVVEMGESPAQACKQKRDSSIVRCSQLVKNREVVACASAGNSGATMAAALMTCGRIDGVLRPAITTMVPRRTRACNASSERRNFSLASKQFSPPRVTPSVPRFMVMGGGRVESAFTNHQPPSKE